MRKQLDNPFNDDKSVLCVQKCRHFKKCESRLKGKVTECGWYDTLETKLERDKRAKDLLSIVNSPAGARNYKHRIEDVMLKPELYSVEGNSTTHVNLGMRKALKLELDTLKRLLKLSTYIDLIIYLDKKSKGA